MTGSPASGALTFEHAGQPFTLVFDMEAIARFEDATNLSIFEAVQGLGTGRPPKLSVLGALLQAALAAHHPGVTRAEAMAMMVNPQVQALFAEGLSAAMPQTGDAGEDGETPPANPPAKRSGRAAGRTG